MPVSKKLRTILAIALLVSWVLSVVSARAEAEVNEVNEVNEGGAQSQARLRYELGDGAAQCPAERVFRDMVTVRLGYVAFSEGAGRIITATIVEQGDALHGRLEVRESEDSVPNIRELEEALGECEELAQSMALAVAVIIDPLSLTRAPPESSDPQGQTNIEEYPQEIPVVAEPDPGELDRA